MKPTPASLAVLLGLSIVVAAARAAAQESPDVEALIHEGRGLRDRREDAAALAVFERAWALAPTPRVRAMIALAEFALGRWTDADAHLREALAHEADPWITRNRELLESSVRTVDGHLATLEVRTNVAGAELWVNDRRAASLPSAPLRLAPGTTVIEVRAAGHLTTRRTVTLEAGVPARETIDLVREPPPPPRIAPVVVVPPVVAPRTVAPRPVHPGVWVTLGVGGAGLAASLVLFGLREGAAAGCAVGADVIECPDAASAERASTALTYHSAMNVTLIAGAVVTAGGAAWLVVDRLRARPTSERRAAWWVSPTADGATVWLRGKF